MHQATELKKYKKKMTSLQLKTSINKMMNQINLKMTLNKMIILKRVIMKNKMIQKMVKLLKQKEKFLTTKMIKKIQILES